jgi:aryl-alcohol dehydrogenase-like predicted oxidoreductase
MVRRELGRSGKPVSVIGLDLANGSGGSVAGPSGLAGLWARAFRAGVDLVDVSGPAGPGHESRLRTVLAGEPPRITAIVPVDGGRPSPPVVVREIPERMRSGVEESVARLGGSTVAFPCFLPSQGAWLDRPETLGTLQTFISEGRIGGWGLRITPATRLDHLAPVLDRGASFLVLPGNLLDHRLAAEVERIVRGRKVALLLRDPHAGGALDGGFLRGSSVAAGPAGRFERWEDLELRLRPVTRLGFLTKDRSRTLSEVAIQFAAGLPGVASVLVPPDDTGALDSAVGAIHGPPLTDSELRQIEEVVEDARAAPPQVVDRSRVDG